ncbi:MAG: hypothetical protein QXH91_03995 [Candidatus Bathyarchaeia archaeon]
MGGIYEHGLIGHQEELVLFNPRDKKQAEAVERFVDTCAEAAAEESLGIGFSLFAGKKSMSSLVLGVATTMCDREKSKNCLTQTIYPTPPTIYHPKSKMI